MTELKQTKGGSAKNAALLLAANIVAGVLTPLGLSWLGGVEFGLAQGTIVGLLITLTLTAAELLLKVEEIYSLRRDEVELWAARKGIDDVLTGIRTGLHTMVADDSLRDSFYLDYYSRELALTNTRVQNTVVRKEILLDRHHIDSTRVLLSIYDSKEHTVFRAIAPLGDVSSDFDVTFSIYFHAWIDMLKSNKVKSLKRIFIYSDKSEFENQYARKLVAVHNSKVRGLEARAVSRDEFFRFKEDYHITDGVDDIGLFSNKYIYRGQTRQGSDISGTFSRDQGLIDTYLSFFDALWDSKSAQPVSAFVSESITVDQLFTQSFMLPSNPLQIEDEKDKENGEGS